MQSSRVQIVAVSDPVFADEENALYRVRLRAATFLLAVGLALVLARDVTFGGGSGWQLQAAAVVGMAFLAVLISAAPSGSSRGLKAGEVAAFGLAAGDMAARLWVAQLAGTARGDAASLATASKDAVIATTVLLFTYALLIPDPRGRRWRAVAVIAACPVIVEVLLLMAHPEVFRLARRVATVQRVAEGLVQLATVAVLAGYGARLINTMRVQARDARQFNQYRVRDEIGSGGMGEVFLAEHRLLKRPCALKLIRPERAGDLPTLEQFEREVRATARLSDPNVVEIYDYGRAEDGTFYYVMEYLQGLSLDELVGRHGRLPAGRVIYLLRQACEALAEAHADGLIHRDLKPANIFAARRGRRYDFVKLLDFGLVKVVAGPPEAGVSREGHGGGTPQYMAPEQVTGDRVVDHRCDLYALGGVAYTLLTGRPPFEGDTRARVLMAQVHDPVVPPTRLRRDVPPDLEQVVLSCLAKEPAGRPRSAEDLERALAACRAAAEWDARKAAVWWEEFGPRGDGPR
jgi:serine/threonine-protein kinase